MNKKLVLYALLTSVLVCSDAVLAQNTEKITPPYTINKCLIRAEDLFRKNDYREALVFYYEGLGMTSNDEISAKLHFRIGECLEAVRRYEFATYHYKLAMKSGKLPDILQSRAYMKLEHLPEMAQTEEATRLFNSAMEYYKKRNIRAAIDDYLASLRLMPTLMEKNEHGLIEDAVKYLTYLSETKDKEPDRLLKLATMLELRGDIEKSVETLQQIIIIYPDSDEATQAEAKLDNFNTKKTSYLETAKPHNAISEVVSNENTLIFQETFEFSNTGSVTRDVEKGGFSLKAFNERDGIPNNRFEWFSITLGKGSEKKDYLFSASDGMENNILSFETSKYKYYVSFSDVSLTKAYIDDSYTGGKQGVPLFSSVRVLVKIEHKYE
ncbi:MAG: hypothetical protein II961_05770 [Candidatus Riflebacteria bacterium]|nr:hypothetical protein [Candidatus Riflebacteria bacterium]